MMTDRRCGTCRHWKRSQSERDAGTGRGSCLIVFPYSALSQWENQGTDCPGWSDGEPEKVPTDAPDKLWIVLDTRGHIVGTYRTPEEAGKAAGWGASIVGYAHSMDEASYRRGWRDAVAAARALADAATGDTLCTLPQAIAELTPPG